MKIAFATDDGTTISQNLLQARYYQVVTLQNGEEVGRDLRAKPQQSIGDSAAHIPLTGQDASDMGEEMLAIIDDCTALVVGGMSRPMHEKIMRYDVRPVLTNKSTVNEALQDFIHGSLDNPYENMA
jgi:predicted Fe-Mo cluster-binding NifX family protein